MSFNLVKIYHEMGMFAKVIAAFLAGMAVASLGVFIERLIFFARQGANSRGFGDMAGPLIERRDFETLKRRADDIGGGSVLAEMVSAGLKVYLGALRKGGAVSPVELVRRDLARKAEAQAQKVRRGMSVLATVGSLAPFVGLLGTVVGIITAFQGIAKEGSGGLGAVSAGIAEALVETAFGLLVAIPAVLAFNYLNGKADATLAALDESRGEFVDALENASGSAGAGGGA
jgi:biopolymer transport protein ExbB